MLPSLSKNMPQSEHLLLLITPVSKTTPINADNPPQKNGAQESTQSISYLQSKSIKNWISAYAQMAEKEDMLPSPSKSMPQSEHLWSLLTLVGKTTPINADNLPQKDGAQESTQSISYSHNKSIKNWISACAQMAQSKRRICCQAHRKICLKVLVILFLQRRCRSTTEIKPSNVIRPNFIPELGRKEFQNLIRQTQYLYQ